MNRELGADNEAALARLKKALIAQPGFQLILLEAPEGPMRAQVLELVMTWSGDEGVPKLQRIRARGRSEIVPRLVSRQGGILLEDIDSALLDDASVDRLVGAMNWQRDQLRKRIAGPLILVVSARGVARLFERAPDLATWRSHTCRITTFASEPSPDRRLKQSLLALEPDPIELERAESILKAMTRQKVPANVLADGWIRVGLAHQRCGEPDQARKAFAKAALIGRNDEATRAWALLHLANLDFNEGRILAVRRRMRIVEPLVARSQDPATRGLWLLLQSELAAKKGDRQASVHLGREAVAATSQRDDLHGPAQLVLVMTLVESGEHEEALAMLESMQGPGNAMRIRVRAYEMTASVARWLNRPDLAVASLRQGIALASSEPGLRDVHLSMIVDLARVLVSIGQDSEARKALRGARHLLASASSELRVSAALIEGIAATNVNSPAAVSMLEAAVRLARGHRDEAMAKLMLSIARTNRGDIEGAKRAANAGLQLARGMGAEELVLWFQPYHNKLFSSEGASTRSKKRASGRPRSRVNSRRAGAAARSG